MHLSFCYGKSEHNFPFDSINDKLLNVCFGENITENLSTSFNPTIFSWLKPNMNYSSAYSWNQDRESTIGGANIGTQLRFSSSIAFSISFLISPIF